MCRRGKTSQRTKRTINNKPNHEKQFTDPILEAILNYNRIIHSATGIRQIELHIESNEIVLSEIHRKLKDNKTRTLGNINKNRIDEAAMNRLKYIKNYKRFKLDNIYKNVRPSNINNAHANANIKNYYKPRFCR